MKNIILVKIQTNVNQRKDVHKNNKNNLLSKISHTIKMEKFDHQNWSDFFV